MPKQRYHDPHPDRVAIALELIGPTDHVLDVGGWWKPFNRADVVVDLMPYRTRGGGGSIGRGPERFSAGTWYQLDMCSERLPFGDGEFDFAYCGQTLEDVRDPVQVCRELQRVAHRGIIEVPSIWIECTFDVDENPRASSYPGYEKHRWLVEIYDDGLVFLPKLVWLCLDRFVPDSVADVYRSNAHFWSDFFLWSGSFHAEELSFAGQAEILPRLRNYFRGFDPEQEAIRSPREPRTLGQHPATGRGTLAASTSP